MTMVLSLLTRQASIQVSDRRVTWLDIATRRPVRFDDTENKAVVFRNRAVLAYTGASRVATERVDRWLTETLGLECRILEGLDHLADRATLAQRAGAFSGLGLAVVAAGWNVVDSAPLVAVASNFLGKGQLELVRNQRKEVGVVAKDVEGSVRSEFSVWKYELPATETHLLHVAGQPLPDWSIRKAVGVVRRALSHSFSVARAIDLLAELIRAAAVANPFVGTDLMATVIPASGLSNPDPVLLSGTPLGDQPTSLYLPRGRQRVRYMANFAGNGAVFTDASGIEDGFRMGISITRSDGCRD